jgi:hypothetical protein
MDTSLGTPPGNRRSTPLAKMLADFRYTDFFRALHPPLPPILESRPRVTRYIPTSSDHHAYLLRPEIAGLALLPLLPSPASSGSLYWKFNSFLVNNSGFLPAFRAMWEPLAARRPAVAPPAALAAVSQQPPAAPTPPPPLHHPSSPPPQLRTPRAAFAAAAP